MALSVLSRLLPMGAGVVRCCQPAVKPAVGLLGVFVRCWQKVNNGMVGKDGQARPGLSIVFICQRKEQASLLVCTRWKRFSPSMGYRRATLSSVTLAIPILVNHLVLGPAAVRVHIEYSGDIPRFPFTVV